MGSGASRGKYVFGSDPCAEAGRDPSAPDRSDVQQVLRQLDMKWPHHEPLHKLKEFNLSSCPLGNLGSGEDLGCTCAWLLGRCKVATKINFSNCGLDNYAFSAMACFLEENPRLADLVFRNNPLGPGAGVGRALVQMLDNCPGARNVHFEECKLDNEALESFASDVRMKPDLLCLALSWNPLGGGAEVGHHLAVVLNMCPATTRICLANCRLDGLALGALADHLEPNEFVNEVDLMGNRFGGGEEVGRSLAVILSKCPAASKFFLSDCRLDEEALVSMGEQLTPHKGLTVLDFSGESLYDNWNCLSGEEAGQSIAKIIIACPSLKTLDLRTSEFDIEALDAMVQQMGTENFDSIVELFLCDREVELNKYSASRLGLAKLQRRCPNAIFYKEFNPPD